MHGDRRIERKQARLYDETRPEGPDKDMFPDLPCQEAAVKNNAGGVKFYAPERVFDRKSSLQMLDNFPLFVPAKSGGKPTLAA